MSLSHDIISEFVKVTNNNKEKPKEGTVYATIVQGSDGKYVKIDGSDLLTPAVTTTDIEDGERVTVMIKDHKATVTGNVTSPSASGNRVDKVVDTVTEQIGVFETVVADKVSTNELEAYKATIEYLVAGKAEIEDLEAINATIENLKVKDAEIENAVIDKATIEDLEAVNAKIENLEVKDAEIENAVVENLEATKADIQILNADFAQIKTLVSGNLTSDNILSFNITADKVTMEDAFIKDAMIANVNAAKINAGRINTNSVVIGSEDGGMSISGATQQFTDKNGNVRIQIGRDTSDDFTFALYGEDGQGQLINQNGITASAISDGIIVNDMISDDASISGGKLDISSVIMEINDDDSTTIKSNKIYLDEQNQSLEVAFKSLKTQVDTIKDIDSDLTTITDKIQSNTSKIEANKSSISTLLAEDAVIKKQVTDLEGNVVETTNTLTSKYTSLQQNLDGFKTTVNNTYATKTSVNDVKNNLSSNYSTTSAMNSAINQKVDEITASVSSTYATKNEVKTIDDNIKANYSTTEQMTSAISVAKDEINLGISKVYETKTEVSNKIGDAVNNIKIGGRNLVQNSDFNNGTSKWNLVSPWEIHPTTTYNGKKVCYISRSGLTSDSWAELRSNNVSCKQGESYTMSVDIKTSGLVASTDTAALFIWSYDSNGGNRQNVGAYSLPTSTDWTRYKCTGIIPSGSTIVRACITIKRNGTVYATNFKLEKGTKATDWTPAPEDVDTSIDNAIVTSKNYTDSQIKISKDAIELGVSQTYETKSSVSSQISSTLTSAKSYADTKKSEAISTASSDATTKANNALSSAKSYADTKKSEAITSANNTLNTTIANYYTKTQTDSAIKVAKDSIDLSVSEKYETKSNVESKISNASTSTLTSAKSYADTKKTEAINTASSDATTKANSALSSAKSYTDTAKNDLNTAIGKKANSSDVYTKSEVYTKTQTDSQISIAKDAINLGISQTYETKTNVTSKVNSAISTASSDATTKVNNALTSAKSYADTKKSEAITSANNTLNTTIANYYTKTQTDSQIKATKDTITSSVSSTYETKTNVQNKIDAITIGGRNLAQGTSSSYSNPYSSFTGVTNTCPGLGKVLTDGLNVGDKVTIRLIYKYTNIVAASGQTAQCWIQGDGNTTGWSAGAFPGSTRKTISGSGQHEFLYTFIITEDHLKNSHWNTNVRHDYVQSGSVQWKMFKVEKGTKSTDWSPAPEDMETTVANLTRRVSTAEQKITDTAITNVVKQNFYTKTETNNQITSKGYQTSSQVQQTVDALQLKFTQSGGYNLFQNSKFNNGYDGVWWTHQYNNPQGQTRFADSSWNWGFPDSNINAVECQLPVGKQDVEYGPSQTIRTTIGKQYTISFYYAGHRCSDAYVIVRGSDGGWAYADYFNPSKYTGGNQTSSNWGYFTLTFTATSSQHTINIIMRNCTDSSIDAFMWIAKPMCEEGCIPSAWAPAANEVYDGVTTINKDGVTVRSNNAYTNFNSAGMNSFNNSGQQTLGIRNGGITFHPYNTNQLGAYVTQSALWSGSVSANGLAISTTNNGTYISLGTSSLSDANTSLNMDQALTISASDGFQPRGINFWKDVHAHGYGIRQLAHLQLAGSSPIQFDYLNTSPSTIYETTSNGHSLYVMGGYQMHLGCMDGSGAPKGVIWMQNSTNTHSYTHWNFHNYTMYNMKTATSYANTLTNRYIETYGINSNVDGIRYLYRNIELVDGVGIRNLPNGYKGCPYDIVSIVCEGRGHAWVECEDEYRFIINGDCKSVNVEIIIYPTDGVMTMSSLAPDESPTLEAIPERNIGEQPVIITNEGSISVESEQE